MEVRPLTLSNARKGVKGQPGLSSSFFKLPFGWAPDVRRQLNCFVRSRSLSLSLSLCLSLSSKWFPVFFFFFFFFFFHSLISLRKIEEKKDEVESCKKRSRIYYGITTCN